VAKAIGLVRLGYKATKALNKAHTPQNERKAKRHAVMIKLLNVTRLSIAVIVQTVNVPESL
jgi:hypothetical protein